MILINALPNIAITSPEALTANGVSSVLHPISPVAQRRLIKESEDPVSINRGNNSGPNFTLTAWTEKGDLVLSPASSIAYD